MAARLLASWKWACPVIFFFFLKYELTDKQTNKQTNVTDSKQPSRRDLKTKQGKSLNNSLDLIANSFRVSTCSEQEEESFIQVM